MLNQEIKLRAFLLCGEVPLSNNQEERMLRPHAVHRATIKYYKTRSGHQAAAVLQSLRMTCERNGVTFLDYLSWLTTEVKYRCEVNRIKSGIRTQTFLMPPDPVSDELQPDGTIKKLRYSLFDERYRCVSDDIDTTGLTPLDYKALRLRRAKLDYTEYRSD